VEKAGCSQGDRSAISANVYAYANIDYDFIPTFNLKLIVGQGF
jgi:hypothetical protein